MSLAARLRGALLAALMVALGVAAAASPSIAMSARAAEDNLIELS